MPRPLPDVLTGHRLDLVLITVPQLLSRDGIGTPLPLGLADPHDVLNPERSPLDFRIAQVRVNPGVNSWLLRLAVLRGEVPVIVGLSNFHDAPDERGMVEIGYRVLAPFRRQGFGREIARTMWRAAAEHPDVNWLRASVSPANVASLSIIHAAGFVRIGEQVDPVDGLEWVFEVAAADYLGRA